MADPGFPGAGGAPISRGVCNPIILQKFCRKLHENERNLDRDGAPLDLQLVILDLTSVYLGCIYCADMVA